MIIKCNICKKEFDKPSHRNQHVKDATKMDKTIKAGDVVRCIDVGGYDMSHLTLDKVYVVEWVCGVNVKLVGVKYSTKVWRFGLVSGIKQ